MLRYLYVFFFTSFRLLLFIQGVGGFDVGECEGHVIGID